MIGRRDGGLLLLRGVNLLMLFSDFPLGVGFVLLSWIDMYIICDRYCIELSLLTWVLSVLENK